MNTLIQRTKVLCYVALVSATAGCMPTRLEAVRVNPHATPGQIYFLPRVEFRVDVERELVRCDVDFDSQSLAKSWLLEQQGVLTRINKRLDEIKLAMDATALVATDAVGSRLCSQQTSGFSESLFERLREHIVREEYCGSGVANSEASRRALVAQSASIHSALLDDILKDPDFESSGARGILTKLGLEELDLDADNRTKAFSALVEMLGRIGTENRNLQGSYSIDVEIRANAFPLLLPDLDEAYSINYQLSRNSVKKTEYEVHTYDNGTLKSINVSIDDQTAAVMRDTFSGLLKVASGLSGFSLPLGGTAHAAEGIPPVTRFSDFHTGEREEKHPCKARTRQQLAERVRLERELQSHAVEYSSRSSKLDDARKLVTAAEDALVAAKRDGKPKEDIDKTTADVASAKLAQANIEASLAMLNRQSQRASSDLRKVRASLTMASHTHFRPESSDGRPPQEMLRGERAALDWFDGGALAKACSVDGSNGIECRSDDASANPPTFMPRAIEGWIAVHLSGRNALPDSPTRTVDSPITGIVYRQPARGVLMICSRRECLDGSGEIQMTSDDLSVLDIVDLPQFGVHGVLPLENKAFQNNVIQASFTETGALTMVKYDSNARAVEQAKLFSESADSLIGYFEARRSRDTARLSSEADKIEERIRVAEQTLALERAQRNLEAFRTGTAPLDSAGDNDDAPNP